MLNHASMLNVHKMLPDPITVTLTPQNPTITAVEVSETRSRPLEHSELQMAGNVIGIESKSRAFLLPVASLDGTDPENGDKITDNAAADWTIKVTKLEQADTMYRCLCIKQR